MSTKLNDKTGYIDSVYPVACRLVEIYKEENKPYWTKKNIIDTTEKISVRIANFIFNK